MTEEQLQEIKKICEQNSINYLGLFGSFARGDHSSSSDIDFLAEYSQPLSLLEKGSLIMSLQKLLGREVDLVSAKHLKPGLRPYVEKDLKTVYEKR